MSYGLAPEIEACLAAQERFELLRRDAQLRAGRELADLAYANSYDPPPEQALAAIREALAAGRTLDLQYTPYGGATITRRMVATYLGASHGLPFEWRGVVMTPGAMAALNVVFRALKSTRGEDEIIVIVPSWLDYPLYLANLGIGARLVPVSAATLRLDLQRIADALSDRTRALVLSQPANPSGLLYSEEELRQLARLLDEHSGGRILLISDECHRDMLFDANSFHSPASFYANTCIVYSFGKRFFIQGQRIGYAAISPRAPQAREFSALLEKLCRVMGFCTPTALMQLAVRRLLEVVPDTSRIVARRARLLDALQSAGHEFHRSQATFFIYPRAPGGDDERWASVLAGRGLLVLPAAVFHHAGFYRLALTAPDEHIERAATILAAGDWQ